MICRNFGKHRKVFDWIFDREITKNRGGPSFNTSCININPDLKKNLKNYQYLSKVNLERKKIWQYTLNPKLEKKLNAAIFCICWCGLYFVATKDMPL